MRMMASTVSFVVEDSRSSLFCCLELIDSTDSTAASRTLEPNQVLILLAARPTGAQWLCPPL
jgi:hypothetical protein